MGLQTAQMTQKSLTAFDRRDPRTYRIIGCAIEVHRHLGCGFLEPVYHLALERELTTQAIPFVREARLPILYKGDPLPLTYRADFVCFGDVFVEVKSVERISDRDEAQIINYLAAGRFSCGLLLNFGSTSLQFKRFAYTSRSRR